MLNINKDELLKGLKSIDDKLLVSKILDKLHKCVKTGETVNTNFFDPYQKNVISGILNKLKPGQINYSQWKFFGGYDGAERQVLVFCPDFIVMDDVTIPVRVLSMGAAASGGSSGESTRSTDASGGADSKRNISSITHRDILGSLMGLGIVREKIGDIIVDSPKSRIIVMDDIADYIIYNLEKVRDVRVKADNISIDELKIPEPDVKEIHTTVPSLRLDCIAGAGFGLSRTKVSEIIESGKVFLNWESCCNSAKLLKQGDVITLRGKGRIILEEVGRTTKKDRIAICINKLI